mgnify:CR=1 FL=1
MKRTIRYYRIMWLKYDLFAGLTVFLVALPLCLGIALASGAPFYAGLLSGIIGGMIVSLISGSQLAVSGPAAGLTTIVSSSIVSFGDYRIFLLTVVIAGLFQVFLGFLKLGIIANYFPSSVIKGMLAAIGIMLISKQIPIALGYDLPDFWRSGFMSLFTSKQFVGGIHSFNQHITRGVIIISIFSILVFLLFEFSFLKGIKIIPIPLLVVILGILMNLLFDNFFPGLSLNKDQLVNIPSNAFKNIISPDFSKFFADIRIWRDGIVIGMLATLETLLCIEAIDKLDRRGRTTPVNRELFAQGIGNIICGFLGAIPITAVVVRGAANVDAGARTKLSAFTHGLFLLLAVVLIPFLLNRIPYASLSAILLVTGYNLTKPKLYRSMFNLGWTQFLPFILTIVVILFTDLLIGVSIGLLLSIYFIIRNNYKEEYKISKKELNGILTEYIKLNTNVTFLNKVNLKKVLDEVPRNSILTIDGSECNFIDYDVLEVISEFENKAKDRNIDLHLIGIKKVDVTAIH